MHDVVLLVDICVYIREIRGHALRVGDGVTSGAPSPHLFCFHKPISKHFYQNDISKWKQKHGVKYRQVWISGHETKTAVDVIKDQDLNNCLFG